jgi:hypothetical protein
LRPSPRNPVRYGTATGRATVAPWPTFGGTNTGPTRWLNCDEVARETPWPRRWFDFFGAAVPSATCYASVKHSSRLHKRRAPAALALWRVIRYHRAMRGRGDRRLEYAAVCALSLVAGAVYLVVGMVSGARAGATPTGSLMSRLVARSGGGIRHKVNASLEPRLLRAGWRGLRLSIRRLA